MAQESSAQRRAKGDSRPTVAAVVVIIALIVFAASFFLLGGPALVSSLFDGAQKSPTKTGSNATPDTPEATAGALALPTGMVQGDAERLYVEQVESKANINKLVKGEITKIAVNKVDAKTDSARIDLTVTFRSGGSGKAVMTLAKFDSSWFVQRLASEKTFADAPATTVEQQKKALGITSIDEGVLATIIDQEKASQEILAGWLDGTYAAMTIEQATQGAGTATLDVTFSGTGGTTTPGQLVAIQDGANGPWIVTTFRKR